MQGEGRSITAEDSTITSVPFRILTQMLTEAKGIINRQYGIVDVPNQTQIGICSSVAGDKSNGNVSLLGFFPIGVLIMF